MTKNEFPSFYELKNFESIMRFYNLNKNITDPDDTTILLNKKEEANLTIVMKNNIIVATDYFNYFLLNKYKVELGDDIDEWPDFVTDHVSFEIAESTPKRSISFEYLLSIYNDKKLPIYDNLFFYKAGIFEMYRNKLWLRTNSWKNIDYNRVGYKRKAEQYIIDSILGSFPSCIDSEFINKNYRYFNLEIDPPVENSRVGFIGNYEPDPFCCTSNQKDPTINSSLNSSLKFDCNSHTEEGSDNYKKLIIEDLRVMPSFPVAGEITNYIKSTFDFIFCSLRYYKNPVFCTYKQNYAGIDKTSNITDFFDVLIIGYILIEIPSTHSIYNRFKHIPIWKVRIPKNKDNPISYILSDLFFYIYTIENKVDRIKYTKSDDYKDLEILIIKKYNEKFKININIISEVEAFDIIKISCDEEDKKKYIVTGCKFISHLKFE
jgi:hypothetical protein